MTATLVLLSHADTDLMVLSKALKSLPEGFSATAGFNLQSLEQESQLIDLLSTKFAQAKVFVLRVLGRTASIPGFAELVSHVRKHNLHLLVISGTNEPNPEFAGISTVPSQLLQEALSYFQAGGTTNLAQLLRLLSDRLLLTGFGYEQPLCLPDQGIYHPQLPVDATISNWLAFHNPSLSTVGVVFYRAHWMSDNLKFIDALIDSLHKKHFNVLPIFTSSLKTSLPDSPSAFDLFYRDGESLIDLLINTTSFAMGDINSEGPTPPGWSANVLAKLNVPILQAITSSMTFEHWNASKRGLNPMDTAMNVVMPEFDGRIITVPISFKSPSEFADIQLSQYEPVADRIESVAAIAERFVRLKKLSNSQKRIAFIFTNSNSKASQIGNAVGLDAPASLMSILTAMKDDGYNITNVPATSDKIIHNLVDRCSYDQTYLSEQQYNQALDKISSKQYTQWFTELPSDLQIAMQRQWGPPPGDAYLHNDSLIIAGLEFGNVMVALQPPRGYGMDPNAIYHQPDLPPTHHYYAFYRWLKDIWNADAIVHVGKHGTLEWLPGKGVGLSKNCFPDAFLGDMPLFYPFILNDPGEGSQAKRRAHAVIVDHLTPAMTTADTYGILAQLVQLVDEYYQVELLDPSKLPLLQQQIWQLVKKANLESDMKLIMSHDHDEDHDEEHDEEHPLTQPNPPHSQLHDPELHSHDHEDEDKHDHAHEDKHDHDHDDDHDHDWNDELTSHGVPVSLAEMDGVNVSHLIQTIDGYLCELGLAEIRDGLHIFGSAPEGDPLIDMLCSLTRLPNLNIPGLQGELATLLGFTLDDLLNHKGARINKSSGVWQKFSNKPLVTNADVLELIQLISHQIFNALEKLNFSVDHIKDLLNNLFPNDVNATGIRQTLSFACLELVPNLRKTNQEITNLLKGLAGEYVPAGPSGAPTRGMAHILPTGRNFYSVDPRSLPSNSAWQIGQQLAHEVLKRHQKETGHYPESVSISVWGTSAMRTHGDDVAEILSLLGTRPIWQPESRRVLGVEVIPLVELKRPRIDVTVRISGFFRDAFPHLIELIDNAVNSVALLDEPIDQNFIRKHYLQELNERIAQGQDESEAQKRSLYRVFGSKPGSYGAGILPLINEKNWNDEHDFAEAFINWGGYAYTSNEHGTVAKDDFKIRLSSVEIALHNQDNREHDIFDSDDYLQFHGGMIATIASLAGRRPRHYFGDSHNPAQAVVRDLKEEALRVFRSRVVNPKWLNSIQRHGYKGGLELTATVDYLFGYDATAGIMEDWMYEQLTEIYALDEQMQNFLKEHNPWALNTITERLLEAANRGMWSKPKEELLQQLQQTYLNSEANLEARGEQLPLVGGVK